MSTDIRVLHDGDLFAAQSEVLVNPVNTVGVMGKGLALAFKRRFPEIEAPYRRACATGDLVPGRVQFLSTRSGTWIANFPTKRHWRNPSQLSWISTGLQSLMSGMTERSLTSVALPALGCGLGGLPWPDVETEIQRAFSRTEGFTVFVYRPR